VAYRGDRTDPLENIIRQRRMIRLLVLLGAVTWVLPTLANANWSSLAGFFVQPGAVSLPQVPSQPAPRPGAVPTAKMTPQALERLLASTPASKHPPVDVRCTPGQSGWDYVCGYRDTTQARGRLKIGVRVSANSILQASAPHQFGDELPRPDGRFQGQVVKP
jgi:hypothetical protein